MTQQLQYAVPPAPRSTLNIARLFVAVPTAVILALAVGGVYGFVALELRTIHFRVGSVIVIAVFIGLIAGGAIRFARSSSRAFAVLFGIFIGVICLWASWVVWTQAVLKMWGFIDAPVLAVLNPASLFRLMRAISRVGVWTYDSRNLHGATLVFYWIAEGLIIVIGCSAIAAAMTETVETATLCPACQKPVKGVSGLARFDGEDTSEVRTRLEAHDFDYLLTLGPPPDEDAPEIVLRLECCPCGEANVLSARRLAWGINSQGGSVLTERALIDGLVLSREQVESVKSLKARMADVAFSRGDGDDAPVPNDEDSADDSDNASSYGDKP